MTSFLSLDRINPKIKRRGIMTSQTDMGLGFSIDLATLCAHVRSWERRHRYFAL